MMHNPQCSYGCGNIAVYLLQFKNQSKWCCSNTFFKCPNYINRISVWKGRKHTEEQKKKIGKSKIGKPLSIEHKQLLSKIKKGKYIGKDNLFYGKSHSIKNKENSRQRMLNGGAANAASKCKSPSKVQVKLFNIIKSIYPSSKMEVPLQNFVLDILIPEYNIIIEYDGEYWHREREEQDILRQNKIESLGFKFIRYKEKDLGYKLPNIEKIKNDISNVKG